MHTSLLKLVYYYINRIRVKVGLGRYFIIYTVYIFVSTEVRI